MDNLANHEENSKMDNLANHKDPDEMQHFIRICIQDKTKYLQRNSSKGQIKKMNCFLGSAVFVLKVPHYFFFIAF